MKFATFRLHNTEFCICNDFHCLSLILIDFNDFHWVDVEPFIFTDVHWLLLEQHIVVIFQKKQWLRHYSQPWCRSPTSRYQEVWKFDIKTTPSRDAARQKRRQWQHDRNQPRFQRHLPISGGRSCQRPKIAPPGWLRLAQLFSPALNLDYLDQMSSSRAFQKKPTAFWLQHIHNRPNSILTMFIR